MLIKFLLVTVLIFPDFIYAQVDSLNLNNDDLIQTVLDESKSDEGNESLLDLIEDLKSNPVNLNEANITELQKIPGLSFTDARSILDYRGKNGIFFSVNELRLTGISEEDLSIILPFVKVDMRDRVSESGNRFISHLSLRNRIINDLQRKEGITDNKFAGNNLHTYIRLNSEFGDLISTGFLLEKDSGEKSYNDLTSGYVSTKNIGVFKKIIVGDYSVQFGQGLAIWSPYSFSKSSNAIYPVKKHPHYLKEYKSSDENKFQRGISATFGLGKVSITTFYSSNKFDARIDSLNSDILSTPVDGLHRTGNEINKKNSSSERMLGLITSFRNPGKYDLSFLYYNSNFKNSFEPGAIYDISGDRFNFYSLSWDMYFDKINFSGESSYNGKSLASIINLQFAFSDHLAFITSFRNYPRNYFNLHSRGFGEQSGTQNEFGIYNGLRWRIKPGVFNFYFDQFRFPFKTYYNPLPSSGNEFTADFLSTRFNNIRLHLKIKREEKEIGKDVKGKIGLFKRLKSSLRVEMIYYPDKNLRLKSRLELSSYKITQDENGFLIFQDARFKASNKIDIAGRIIFFRTDSFNTAIYEFENDLGGVFSSYGLYKEGIRWYAMMKIKLPGSLLFSIKYSETYKPFEKSLGSGYSEINGNLDNRLGLQLDLKI